MMEANQINDSQTRIWSNLPHGMDVILLNYNTVIYKTNSHCFCFIITLMYVAKVNGYQDIRELSSIYLPSFCHRKSK